MNTRIIKGCWHLAGGHGLIERDQAIKDMQLFVENGITTFDCADIYTGVEELIGLFLKKEKNVRVHTKFVPDLDVLPTISKRYVEKGIDRSLKRLGVEQLDMVQFHWWDFDIPGYVRTASFLKKLQISGKIRDLSVSNFDVVHLKELVDAGIRVFSNQVQYSLLDHRPEHGMVEYCKNHDIVLLCYGSLAGGFLSDRYLGMPQPTEPLENRSLTKYLLIIEEFGGWKVFQKLLMVLQRIAQKHGVTIADIAMRYILEKDCVRAIIVGARNANHVERYQNLFRFCLDRDDKEKIREVVYPVSGPLGDIYSIERVKDGKHARIMKYNLNNIT